MKDGEKRAADARGPRHGDGRGSRGNGGVHGFLKPMALLSLLFSGAIFGVFYAWVCSTMWGLDAADPNIAIAAMQAMNASVRNPVFAPAFFGTPLILGATALAAGMTGNRRAALLLGAAGGVYVAGAMVPTIAFNVPMNQALALVETPLDAARARDAWQAYSAPWQLWNTIRAVFSGLALLLAGAAVPGIRRPADAGAQER